MAWVGHWGKGRLSAAGLMVLMDRFEHPHYNTHRSLEEVWKDKTVVLAGKPLKLKVGMRFSPVIHRRPVPIGSPRFPNFPPPQPPPTGAQVREGPQDCGGAGAGQGCGRWRGRTEAQGGGRWRGGRASGTCVDLMLPHPVHIYRWLMQAQDLTFTNLNPGASDATGPQDLRLRHPRELREGGADAHPAPRQVQRRPRGHLLPRAPRALLPGERTNERASERKYLAHSLCTCSLQRLTVA